MKYYTSYNIYFSSLGDHVKKQLYIYIYYFVLLLLGLETYTTLQNVLGIVKTFYTFDRNVWFSARQHLFDQVYI